MLGFLSHPKGDLTTVRSRLGVEELERVEALEFIEASRTLFARLLRDDDAPSSIVGIYSYRHLLRKRQTRMIDLGESLMTTYGYPGPFIGMALDEDGTVWETVYTRLLYPCEYRRSDLRIADLLMGFHYVISMLPASE